MQESVGFYRERVIVTLKDSANIDDACVHGLIS